MSTRSTTTQLAPPRIIPLTSFAQTVPFLAERGGQQLSGVVVLNTDNTALHTVSIKHAIKMLVREVAIVEEAHEGRRIGPPPGRWCCD